MENSGQSPDWIETAMYKWYMTGVSLEKGATLSSIAECEENIGFKFPQDFIDLYVQANGFKDFGWNEHMFSLWSLDRIKREYHADESKSFVGFCDFLINSHSLGFLKTDAGIYKSYDETEMIANSFSEVIEMINISSDKIY